jgi:hypothetical protein
MKSFLTVIGAVALSGCAHTLDPDTMYMNVYTDPVGGRVAYWNGKEHVAIGFSPQTVKYTITPAHRKTGSMTLSAVQIQWASGASASSGTIRADLAIGNQQKITVRRPAGAPGLDVDFGFAAKVEEARRREAAESRANDTAGLAALLLIGSSLVNGYNAANESGPSSRQTSPSYSCTSRPSIATGQVQTECQAPPF